MCFWRSRQEGPEPVPPPGAVFVVVLLLFPSPTPSAFFSSFVISEEICVHLGDYSPGFYLYANFFLISTLKHPFFSLAIVCQITPLKQFGVFTTITKAHFFIPYKSWLKKILRAINMVFSTWLFTALEKILRFRKVCLLCFYLTHLNSSLI